MCKTQLIAEKQVQAKVKTIAIIGGGIAGLISAISLATTAQDTQQNIKIKIYEKQSFPNEEGAGLQLSPNVTHILRKLGLLAEILKLAAAPENIIMATGTNNKIIADIPLGNYADEIYGAPYLVIHRADLHAVLTQKATELKNISLLYGHELNNIIEQEDHLQLIIKNQYSSFIDISNLIIAADGVWSKSKNILKLNLNNPVAFSGHIAWRGLIPSHKLNEKYKKSTYVWLGSRAHMVLYPIENGKRLNLIVLTEGQYKQKGWALDADINNLKTQLFGWHDDCFNIIKKVENFKTWPLCGNKPDYQEGFKNMVFVGDAAHPTLPYQAQGAAMAIEDAAVLSNMLRQNKLFNETGISVKNLRHYEAQRKDRVIKTQKAALDNAEIFHMAPPKAYARNIILRLISNFANTRLLTRLNWLYAKRYDNF